MTTIAWRNGVMAGDTAGNAEKIKAMEVVKVHRLANGWVAGYCGTLCIMGWLIEELSTVLTRSAPQPNLLDISDLVNVETDGNNDAEDVCMLLAHRRHGVYRLEVTRTGQLMALKLEDGYHAIGSGEQVAFGALHQGATAREAVEAAITHDHCTGGHIVEVSV